MNPYEKYKSTNIPWLPQVPEHWNEQQLRHLLRPVSIKNRPEMPLLSVERERGVIIRDLEDTKSNHNFIPDDLSGYKFVQKDQFVINKMKAWQGSYGLSPIDGIVSPAYYVFNLLTEDKTFFSKAIRSKSYVPFFTRASDGIRVGQWDLDMDRMKNIIFYTPPISESKQITRYLNWKVSEIVRLIIAKKKQIKLLEEQKRAVINNAVTRGINPDATMKDTRVSWLGEVPFNWKIQRGKHYFFAPKEININNRCKNILSLTLGGVIRNNDDKPIGLSPKSYSSYQIFNEDDLVFKLIDLENFQTSRVGLVFEKGAMSPAYIRLAKRPNVKINVRYFYFQYYDLYLRKIYNFLGNGVRSNLSSTDLLNITTACPPYNEQNEIVDYIDKKINEINITINAIKNEISLLQEYKVSLISNVVTGQIDVRYIAVPDTEPIIDDIEEEEEQIDDEEEDNTDAN